MRKFFNGLGSFTALFLTIFFIYGEIFGIVHSYRKHSKRDLIASIAIPPWAWYRSIEMWWHDDNENIDWDKRLPNDLHACMSIVSYSYEQTNNPKIYKHIEDFSNEISNYPADKLKYLKRATKTYMKYLFSIYDDFAISMYEFYEYGKFYWNYSAETINLEKELKKFDLGNDLELAKEMMNNINEQLSDLNPMDLTEDEFNKLVMDMKLLFKSQKNESIRMYKTLFNENFIDN